MSSTSEDYSTCEELQEFFSKKISLLNECVQFKNMDNNALVFFRNFQNSLIELRHIFQQIKCEIKKGHDQLEEMKQLFSKMESLNERLDHMQKNFPAVLKPSLPVVPKREDVKAPSTPVVTKKVKTPARISHLTLTEFESVPKYMRNRIQYGQINSFIDSFNKVIDAKYKLLTMPRKLMKQTDVKVRNEMKLEENEQTKGCYFCTANNMKEYADIKMDKATNNYICILRHCKRLKEVRGPGPINRFVVLT